MNVSHNIFLFRLEMRVLHVYTTEPLGIGMCYARTQSRKGSEMGEQVVEISTEVFRLLQKRAPAYVSWSDEKPGPTQRILVEDDVYNEFIDRAIAKQKTLDQVITEVCVRTGGDVDFRVPHLPLQRTRRYG